MTFLAGGDLDNEQQSTRPPTVAPGFLELTAQYLENIAANSGALAAQRGRIGSWPPGSGLSCLWAREPVVTKQPEVASVRRKDTDLNARIGL